MTTDTTTDTTASMLEAAKAVWGEDSPTESPGEDGANPSEATREPAKADAEKEPSVSARIAAAKRAQSQADKRRIAVEQQQREVQARQAAIEARAKEQEEREARLRLMEEDPAEYFRLKNAGAKEIQRHLERLANGVKPEEVADKRLSAAEVELKKLREELAAKEEAERQRAELVQRAEIAKASEKAFVDHLQSSLDNYPNLIQEFTTPESAIKAGYEALHETIGTDSQGRSITRIAAFIAKNGRRPNNEEIAAHLDSVAKQRIEARAENAWRKRGSDAQDTGSRPSDVTRPSPPAALGTNPRTLSTRDSGSRSSVAAPSRRGYWSQDDQDAADEESLRILNQRNR